MKICTRRLFTTLIAVFCVAIAGSVLAQSWPARTLKIVVPSPPASATDLVARLVAEKLPAVLGQAVFVDNKPGAGSNIAHEFVARQPADGYTILLTQNTLATVSSFYKKLSYDPVSDFAPVSLIVTTPLLLAVNSTSPVKSLKDFIDYARANPNRATYASAGIGTPHHLAMVMLGSMTGIEMTHVPYKGSAPATQAILANDVTIAVAAVTAAIPHIQQNKLRALGVIEAKRSSLLPDVPTLDETLPGVILDVWLGVLVPAGTPRPIVERLNVEINKLIRDPQVRPRLLAAGIEPAGTTPERFSEVLKADIAKFAKLVQAANITPE